MSVVVVKKTKNKIVISADNQVSIGPSKILENERGVDDAKLFQINGMVVGSAGLTSLSSLFRLFCSSRTPESDTEISMLNFLSDFSEWVKKKDSSLKMNNSFIVIYSGKIFTIRGFEVHEVTDFTAIGSGSFLALGAITMGADTEKAVEIAKKYDLYCGGETVTIEVNL